MLRTPGSVAHFVGPKAIAHHVVMTREQLITLLVELDAALQEEDRQRDAEAVTFKFPGSAG
jgi:hypothetical protein